MLAMEYHLLHSHVKRKTISQNSNKKIKLKIYKSKQVSSNMPFKENSDEKTEANILSIFGNMLLFDANDDDGGIYDNHVNIQIDFEPRPDSDMKYHYRIQAVLRDGTLVDKHFDFDKPFDFDCEDIKTELSDLDVTQESFALIDKPFTLSYRDSVFTLKDSFGEATSMILNDSDNIMLPLTADPYYSWEDQMLEEIFGLKNVPEEKLDAERTIGIFRVICIVLDKCHSLTESCLKPQLEILVNSGHDRADSSVLSLMASLKSKIDLLTRSILMPIYRLKHTDKTEELVSMADLTHAEGYNATGKLICKIDTFVKQSASSESLKASDMLAAVKDILVEFKQWTRLDGSQKGRYKNYRYEVQYNSDGEEDDDGEGNDENGSSDESNESRERKCKRKPRKVKNGYSVAEKSDATKAYIKMMEPIYQEHKETRKKMYAIKNVAKQQGIFWRGKNPPHSLLKSLMSWVERDFYYKFWILNNKTGKVYPRKRDELKLAINVGKYMVEADTKEIKWTDKGTNEMHVLDTLPKDFKLYCTKDTKSSYAFYILLYNEKDDGDSYVKLSLLDTRPLLSDRLPTLTIADELKCHNYNVHDFDGDTRLFAYLHESVDNEGDKYYLTAIDTTIADKPVRTSHSVSDISRMMKGVIRGQKQTPKTKGPKLATKANQSSSSDDDETGKPDGISTTKDVTEAVLKSTKTKAYMPVKRDDESDGNSGDWQDDNDSEMNSISRDENISDYFDPSDDNMIMVQNKDIFCAVQDYDNGSQNGYRIWWLRYKNGNLEPVIASKVHNYIDDIECKSNVKHIINADRSESYEDYSSSNDDYANFSNQSNWIRGNGVLGFVVMCKDLRYRVYLFVKDSIIETGEQSLQSQLVGHEYVLSEWNRKNHRSDKWRLLLLTKDPRVKNFITTTELKLVF